MPPFPRGLRAVPWSLVLEGVYRARQHWQGLTPQERDRLTVLVRRSKGRPANLSKRERDEARRLVEKLDVPGIAREMVPFVGRLRRSARS